MLLSPIGLAVDQLDTPALLLDLDAFEANVRTMADHFRSRSVSWRPHAKAFKSPAIAHALARAGAIGVTVAKVSEAEVMAGAGIRDILVAHLVVGPSKVARLAALQRQAEVKATVDHPDHLAPMAAAAREAGVEVGVLVDVDLGMGRNGVRSVDDAVSLSRRVADTPGLRFDGLMGYEGHTLFIPDQHTKRLAIGEAIGRLVEAKEAVEEAGLPCRIVSAGGTGSYQYTADIPGLTELQAGGGVFACRYYTEVCRVVGHRPAISVLATVVGRPTPSLAILDIGRKSISDYQTPPVLLDYPSSTVIGLSAEHVKVELGADDRLSIGDRVRVVPGYSDFTFVLHDRILACRGGRVEAVWPLLGRGMLQ
ncbi:DSD1 family PLP-dependent enzyme [Tautonia sociabilis]|uniref:DSD1 family PLP-dependent enzyme n=1 Tax=Tautonia sociabilis TaxID=2080755 RepID=A0A432MJC9_9BACT|nr:DSD1 family PLP-dependent enzyme [Tautonia sociabilis]RUL87494.1 DSD1 family PLP-dependent enzyme [Tautonia sociabilis]